MKRVIVDGVAVDVGDDVDESKVAEFVRKQNAEAGKKKHTPPAKLKSKDED